MGGYRINSIMSDDYKCYVCGNTKYLNVHHVFYGTANRQNSEDYGCWIYLCTRHHTMGSSAIHNNRVLDNRIKRLCQQKWEERFGGRDEFIKVFGRSYL